MSLWRQVSRGLRVLTHRHAADEDVADEVQHFLDQAAAEFVARGLSPEEARRAAKLEVGTVDAMREEIREQGWENVVESFFADLRYGLRMLRKSHGFTTVAVLTLALGIGANTAIFQMIDAVRLRTLPVKDPDTLAVVQIHTNHWGGGNFNGPYPEFTFPLWKQVERRQGAFSSIAAWSGNRFNLAQGGEVDSADTILVSGDFFRTLGVQPFIGRLISAPDDQTGCAGGVDLSYAFWQRYGGSANVMGKTLTLQGHPFPILGVTPPNFYGVSVGNRFDLAVPLCAEPILDGNEFSSITGWRARETWWLSVFGRLKPGWNLARASAQLDVITQASLQETIPPQYDASDVKHYLAYKFYAASAANGLSNLRDVASDPLWLLLGLSGLVLLIACANLANLMLARASSREREVAVRLALGASRARLIRQLLSEGALLAFAGAVCGVFLSAELSHFLIAFMSTPYNPIFLDMSTDWRVLGFAGALAIATTILFGLAPALRAGSIPTDAMLKTGGRGMTAGRQRFRLQRILIVSQVAFSLVLLAGALLFARSLRNLLTRNPGFQENGVLVAYVDFTRLDVPVAERDEFARNVLDRLRAIPGVAAAANATRSPFGGSSSRDQILGDRLQKEGSAWTDYVSPGYFATIEDPILAGRDFNLNDTATSQKVAIVSQSFVKQFLNSAKDPTGEQFRVPNSPGKPALVYHVVGVVKDSVYNDMHAPVPVMYFPHAQLPPPFTDPNPVYLIRARPGLNGLSNAVKDAIVGVNPQIDIFFSVLRTQVRNSLLQDELMATLCGFFGGLAVLLAAMGLYGVISYTVAQRTNEIGIRMALGGQRRDVIGLILREVGSLIGIGVVVGAGLALAGSATVGSLLYGLKARDPLTLVAAAILLAAIGFAASSIPARRAMSVDPMVALRYE
jgi:putative ABC transport system permease protein